MISRRLLVSLGSLVAFASLLHLWRTDSSQAMTAPRVILRRALPADVDILSSIAMASLPLDPQWDYRFPYAKTYPDDHQKYTRIRYGEYLANQERGACAIMIAELPSLEHPTTTTPVSFAIWLLPGAHLKKPAGDGSPALQPPADHLERRDANSARMQAFRTSLGKAKYEFFDSKFGESQMNLMTLATHPDYFRRGAGKALCNWGIEKAVADGLAAVTLFSSPMGKLLYDKLGFKDVGMVRTQVDGEQDFIDFPAMLLEPRKNAAS